jgi:ribosomal protein S13
MFLLGQTLNPFKRVKYALLVFEGVGMTTAERIMNRAYIHTMCKINELTEEMVERLRIELQPIINDEKQRKLIKLQKERTAIKPILPK